MNKYGFCLLVIMMFACVPAFAAKGLITVPSQHSVSETVQRLQQLLNKKGMTVFAVVRHSDAASKIGIDLPANQLVIFGNPKAGSPLMQCQLSVAIDLPQKMLIWSDQKKNTWISYNDPQYLRERHAIKGCEKPLVKIEKALKGIVKATAGP